jgi:hypothetical protein
MKLIPFAAAPAGEVRAHGGLKPADATRMASRSSPQSIIISDMRCVLTSVMRQAAEGHQGEQGERSAPHGAVCERVGFDRIREGCV